MELESLSCNNCGAPVEVMPTTNFLTCAHCDSRLMVKRTETAHYTEVLGELSQRTERMDDELQELRKQNALLQLDRDWEQERRKYLLKGSEPDEWALVAVGLAVLVSLGFTVYVATQVFRPLETVSLPWSSGSPLRIETGPPPTMICVALLVLGVAIGLAVSTGLNYTRYMRAKELYMARRRAITGRNAPVVIRRRAKDKP